MKDSPRNRAIRLAELVFAELTTPRKKRASKFACRSRLPPKPPLDGLASGALAIIEVYMIILVEETNLRRGRFDGWVEGYGQVVSSSPTPFLTGARALLRLGADPEETLIMRHKRTGTDSLKGPIGNAAKLGVRETPMGPRFCVFKPLSLSDIGDDD